MTAEEYKARREYCLKCIHSEVGVKLVKGDRSLWCTLESENRLGAECSYFGSEGATPSQFQDRRAARLTHIQLWGNVFGQMISQDCSLTGEALAEYWADQAVSRVVEQ